MSINIYSVRNHLEEEGWKLISDTYKNLDTELEMICPEGHKQFQTYKKWRKHPLCEQCMAGDPYKVKKWLQAAIKEWEPDFIGIENIQLQKYGKGASQVQVKTFQTLANLQGVLLDTAFEASIDHDLAYSNEWRAYCGVSGGDTHRDAQKKAAQAKVKFWYNINCTEDEADAICIGKYFTHLLKKNKSTWGENI